MSGWKVLDRDSGSVTDRMAVPGGWIYRTQRICLGMLQPPATLCFVPATQGPVDVGGPEAEMDARLTRMRNPEGLGVPR